MVDKLDLSPANSGAAELAQDSEVAAPTAANADHDVGTLLPDPLEPQMAPGDVVAYLAMLLARAAQQDRSRSREAALRDEHAILEQGRRQVAQMHAKADAVLWGAVVQGAASIVAGSFQLGGAIVDRETTQLKFGAASKIADGLGNAWAGLYRSGAAHHDAEAERRGNLESAAERRYQLSHEEVSAQKELIRRVLEWIADVQRTRSATLLAAARG